MTKKNNNTINFKTETKIETEIEEIKNYLGGYKLFRSILELEKYEREFLHPHQWTNERPGDITLAKAQMFEIRHFVLDLPNSNEKILLYLHYIDCEPIEHCADIMNISRSSAFRLKKRALALAANYKKIPITPKKVPILKFA